MYNRSDSSRASIWSFLFPCLLFFRGSHTTSLVTCGFNRSYNQVAQVPSSKVTCNFPCKPWIKSRMAFALVSITHSITSFPESLLTAIEILSLCTSMPIYLVLVIKGCSFLEGFEPNTQNLTPKGAPFLYCVVSQPFTSSGLRTSIPCSRGRNRIPAIDWCAPSTPRFNYCFRTRRFVPMTWHVQWWTSPSKKLSVEVGFWRPVTSEPWSRLLLENRRRAADPRPL